MTETQRHWCFTLHTESQDRAEAIGEGETFLTTLSEYSFVAHAVYQLEEAPTTGRLHLQGVVAFTRPVRMSYIKKRLGQRIHWEKGRGTYQECIDYCIKPETKIFGPWEVDIDSETDMCVFTCPRSYIRL